MNGNFMILKNRVKMLAAGTTLVKNSKEREA